MKVLALALLLVGTPTPTRAQERPEPCPTAIVAAARAQIGVTVRYDPSYRRLAFPNGDVEPDRGVCTDVVIRALRAIGLDLQALVHRDMENAFSRYPKIWGLSRPDSNIDHRRVPNLETFFARHQSQLEPPASQPDNYNPGDLVTWRLPNGLPHIGVISDEKHAGRPLVVHNIGAGTELEDVLFTWPVHQHIRLGVDLLGSASCTGLDSSGD